MSEIYPKLLGADGILIATPVYFARLSGHLANFLDRLRVFVEGNRYGKSLEDKVGGALAVGWFRNSGVETALLTILYAYFVLGMIPVGPDSQWGASGLSSEGGTGKFVPGDKLGVLKDEYGLQAAQMLAGRVVKIAKLLKAGVAR
jgi:multimeric flavodoxin WrbA